MFWSFAYLVARNLFALVLLVGRSRRSKEVEILVLRHDSIGRAASGTSLQL